MILLLLGLFTKFTYILYTILNAYFIAKLAIKIIVILSILPEENTFI